ncbi:MAG: lactate utilization protein [Chloroflexota bacterium]
MIEERDVSQEERWYAEQAASKCIKGLDRRNIPAAFFPARSEARDYILTEIPPEVIVGFGDSVTLHQVGVHDALQKRGQKIVSPFWRDGQAHHPETVKELVQTGKAVLSADFFLSGANAITADGRIVNTDGLGNRLAGMMFGPKRVILVAGVNKVVKDLDAAFERIKKVAAPLNSRRHQLKHGMDAPPCAQTGECVDCRGNRICCFTLIIEHQHRPVQAEHRPRIQVVLIGEKLGL